MKKVFVWFLMLSLCFITGCNSSTTDVNESNSDNQVFKWEATGDVSVENTEETKILEVGKDIDAGEYIMEYSYEDYSSLGQQTTNKYNRYYFVYISNIKVDNVNGENVNNLDNIISTYNFYPESSSDKKVTITLEDGNYVYIYHTANKEAGYGTLTITKK